MSVTPALEPPAGRYGPERSRRWGRVAVVAAVVVAVVVVAWLGWGIAQEPVRWKDVAFDVQGPASVEATFEVSKDPGTTVECRVHALSESYGEVGMRTVEVGPSDAGAVRVTVVIPTAERAVTATVESCEKVG